MGELDDRELIKLMKLCRIECTEEEQKALKEQLHKVLSYIDLLNEVETTGVEPCSRVLTMMKSVMREDVVGELLSRDLFLANAPSHVGGMIRVPPVIKVSNS